MQRELQELFWPWRRAYNVVAKMRKTRGRITANEDKKSSICYCLVLEKVGQDEDVDTASLSTFTEEGSEADVGV